MWVYWWTFWCHPTRSFWFLFFQPLEFLEANSLLLFRLFVCIFHPRHLQSQLIDSRFFLSSLFPHHLYLIGFSLSFLRKCANMSLRRMYQSNPLLVKRIPQSLLFSLLFSRKLELLFWLTTSRGRMIRRNSWKTRVLVHEVGLLLPQVLALDFDRSSWHFPPANCLDSCYPPHSALSLYLRLLVSSVRLLLQVETKLNLMLGPLLWWRPPNFDVAVYLKVPRMRLHMGLEFRLRQGLRRTLGGGRFCLRFRVFRLRLSSHVGHIRILVPALPHSISSATRRIVASNLRWLPGVVSHALRQWDIDSKMSTLESTWW